MKKITLAICENVYNKSIHLKFAITEGIDDQLIYRFEPTDDPEFVNRPYSTGIVSKLQLTELRKFIDEALEEIEKSENVL